MLEEEPNIPRFVHKGMIPFRAKEDKLTHNPSELSNCRRKLWYAWKGVQAPRSDNYLEVAEDGTNIHALIIDWFKRAKLWVGDNVRVANRELKLRGNIDVMIMWCEQIYPVEIKTLQKYVYEELLRQGGRNDDYEMQINCYLHLDPHPAGFLLYFCRDNANWQLFRYPSDENLWQYTVEKIKSIDTYLELDALPDRDFKKDDPVNGWHCSPTFCQYRKICWGD